MELNRQVFKAPGIPKIGKKSVSSSKIRGALNPQSKLRSSTFSFVRPIAKNVDTEKISGGTAVASNLAETNQILVEIQNQLAIDFAYRIAEEKRAIAAEKKKIAAQKVADKESRIEKGGRNLLGKTFSKVTAPFKSIFQKLIDFFSIILTGILFNTAFKWLSKEENRKKLKEFFNFLKDYWQELLIIFGAYKLARLVGKIYKIGRTFRKLFDVFKKKPPKLPCKCPKTSPTTDICGKMLDCVKDPASKFVSILAGALVAGGLILGAGAVKTLEELLKGGLLPSPVGAKPAPTPTAQPAAAPLTAAKPEQKPTYEQIKANFNPSYDWSYYKKLGLSYGQWLKLQDEATSKPRGGYTVFATKPGETFDMALNLLTVLQGGALLKGGITGGMAALRNPALMKSGFSRFTGLFARKSAQKTAQQAVPQATQQSLPGLGRTFAELQKSNKILSRHFKQYGVRNEDDLFRILGPRLSDTPSVVRDNILNPNPAQRKQYLDLIKKLLDAKTTPRQLNIPITKSKGGTVPRYSGGGTVFGQGSGLIDSVKALLAPGEEVIRASMAKLFRPLLKNINDKGGKEWLAFSGGVSTLLLNNRIQAELNRDFKKVIVKFTELVEEQIAAEKKKKRRRNNSGGNGGNRPQTAINLKKPAMPQRSGGGSDLGVNMMQNIIVNQTPVSVSNNVLQPSINKSGIVVVPITVGDLQAKKQQPKVNVINLPPKTVNLAPKQGSVKTPSSGSATEVPSISPVDAGNPYISSLRLEYGMVM